MYIHSMCVLEGGGGRAKHRPHPGPLLWLKLMVVCGFISCSVTQQHYEHQHTYRYAARKLVLVSFSEMLRRNVRGERDRERETDRQRETERETERERTNDHIFQFSKIYKTRNVRFLVTTSLEVLVFGAPRKGNYI